MYSSPRIHLDALEHYKWGSKVCKDSRHIFLFKKRENKCHLLHSKSQSSKLSPLSEFGIFLRWNVACKTCMFASAEEYRPRRPELVLTLRLSDVKNSRTAPLPTRNAFSINATIFSNYSQLSWHTTGVPRWLEADSVLTTAKCFPWSLALSLFIVVAWLCLAGGFKDVVS